MSEQQQSPPPLLQAVPFLGYIEDNELANGRVYFVILYDVWIRLCVRFLMVYGVSVVAMVIVAVTELAQLVIIIRDTSHFYAFAIVKAQGIHVTIGFSH